MRRCLLLSIDLCLIAVATILAQVLRDNFVPSLERFEGLALYATLTLVVAVPVWIGLGLERGIWRFSAMGDYLRVLAAVVVTCLLAIALGFAVNRLEGVARSLPVLQGLLAAFLLVGARVLIRLRHSARQRLPELDYRPQGNAETVLVVGISTIAELYLRAVAEFAADRVKIAGLVGRAPRHTGRYIRQHQIFGIPEELVSILETLEVHGTFVDRIVLTMPFDRLSARAQAALLEIETSREISVEFFAERISSGTRSASGSVQGQLMADLDPVFSFPSDDLERLAQRRYWRVKRALDVVGALCLLGLLSPLLISVAAFLAVSVGPPVTFWQQRPGLGGRPFKLYKFRTMAAAHDEHGRRVPDDQRVSVIGSFLRRSRLDELPQLYNILIGDMSFVGPRPLLPADQSPAYAARLKARPGLTGWAQVKGGREINALDKAALDVWYVQNASLLLDLKIICATIPMVFYGERVNTDAIKRAWSELRGRGICGTHPTLSGVAPEVISRDVALLEGVRAA